jgi:ribosomal protein S18 acetylase RimI-like enzyme
MDLATLFHAAYSISYRGGLGKLGAQSLEERLSRVEGYLKPGEVAEICHRASTLIYEGNSNKLIGACIIGLGRCITQPAVPKVFDIAVHPHYQRRGLATKMLKKALTILKSEYPTLRFGVAIGNPAEAVYYSLGFLPGTAEYRLVMPPTAR